MIREAKKADIPAIYDLAVKTWKITYPSIISNEQIDYMIEKMYSKEKLNDVIEKEKFNFLLFEIENQLVGFCSIEHNYNNEAITRIHKLYVDPEVQGKKIGQQLLANTQVLAVKNNSNKLHLNVNKKNLAVNFYFKQDFSVEREEVLDIGNGFVMDDYVMIKEI
jgi:N-acetylglutamate synthase-like GNAT family acetyltransferase